MIPSVFAILTIWATNPSHELYTGVWTAVTAASGALLSSDGGAWHAPDFFGTSQTDLGSIIFVHGLRGHPRKTWTKERILWPQDLLGKDISNARIMSWGYDAQVANFFEKSSQCSIFDHAQQLLQDISMERSRPDEKERPIFFVAHSLGGLVVKDALCTSHAASWAEPILNPRIAAIKSATYGIVFLGTPHRGSEKAKWAGIATNLMGLVLKDHNSKVTDSLVRGAETLGRIQTDFSKFLITLPVWTILEDHQYEKIGKIVDDDSATLGFPHEQMCWIPANHENMVKFSNAQEIGYRRVKYAISTLIEDSLTTRQTARRRGDNNRPKQKCIRYISMKEHIFPDPKFLSFGCDEFVGNVLTCPGRWWHGEHRGKKGLFLKDSVEEAPEVDSAIDDEITDSWLKSRARLSRQNTMEGSWKCKSQVEEPKAAEPNLPNPHITPPEADIHPGLPTSSDEGPKMLGSGTEQHEALLISAEEGHNEAVLRLIRKSVDVNATGGVHGHALCMAAYHGRKEIVKTLLDNGALVNLPAGRDGYALHAAAAQGHLDVVKVLLHRHADVQIQGGIFRFALTAAAFNGNVRTVKLLHNEGAELNARDTENESALHGAVWGGHVEVVKYLLDQGIQDSEGTENGTALEMAKQTGQRSIISLFTGEEGLPEPAKPQPQVPATPTTLKVDTTTEVADDAATNALISQYLVIMLVASAGAGNLEDLQGLLDANVDPDGTWAPHGSALYVACANGQIEIAQLLLERGANVHIIGGEMDYCLHAACALGNIVLVLLLIAWGADIHVCTTELGYPLHVASAAGHIPIMKLLLDLGTPVNAWGGRFGTPLIAAAYAGLLPSQYLVSRQANLLSRSPTGVGAVDMARACGHEDAKRFFKLCGAKSSGLFSVVGLTSHLCSFSLNAEKANLERESEAFIRKTATVAT